MKQQPQLFAPVGYRHCTGCRALLPENQLRCDSRRCTQLRANAHLKALKRAFDLSRAPAEEKRGAP